MMTYAMTTAFVLLARVRSYTQNNFRLRTAPGAQQPGQSKVCSIGTEASTDIIHELNLKDYRGFVERALQNYRGDVESCDNSGERNVLLQHGVRLMRKEMSAEADRLYTCYGYAIPDESRFKTELHGLAENAVFQLQNSGADC